MKARKVFFGLFALTLVAFTVYLLRWIKPPEDKPTAARKCLQFLVERNANALMPYISRQEAEATGLTSDGLQQLFDHVLNPRLAGFEIASEIVEERRGATVVAGYRLRHPDGRSTFLGVEVVDGENGPVLQHFVYDCVLTALEAEFPSDPSQRPPTIGLFAALQPPLSNLLPTLKQLQIRGVYLRMKASEDPKLYTWEELLAFYEQRAGKYQPTLPTQRKS